MFDDNYFEEPKDAITNEIVENVLLDMPNEVYHSKTDYLSASNLKELLKNPYAYFNPIEREFNPNFVIGTLIHLLILEPHNFDKEFAIAPDVNKRTKDGRAELEQFAEDMKGFNIISQSEYDTYKELADSVLSIPAVQALLQGVVCEKSYFATLDDGTKVKCRPDAYNEAKKVIIDVKSCNDASPDAFKKDIAKYGYHVQDSHYRNTLGARKFIFLAVEKKPPYMVGIYELSAPDLELGDELVKEAIKLSKSPKSYEYPLYVGEDNSIVQTLVLPNYVHYRT